MKTVLVKKKYVALLAAVCMLAINAWAQPPGDKGDKIEALRIAFISERLNLTPEEAQKFWPVYNSFRADLKTLRQNYGLGPGKPDLSADDALDFEQKKLDLKKKYKLQFEAAIGKDKVNILYQLEEEFKQKLKELRDQRMKDGGGPGHGPPPRGGR